MSCNCEPRKYEISMGCCQPVLGPIENYYTKYEVDKLIESATTSGCCITPEEVDEKIDEAISGITVSGVTQEELDEAIASAKTQIEAEIPTVPTSNTAFTNDAGYLTEHQSLEGYATEQWVLDKHYISGIDLSDYATKDEIPTVPTKVSAFENDVPYLTEHQSLSGYATEQWVSSFTYDKATIDEKVAEGGTFDPTQYYNKTATNALLDEKLDVTAYTPTDLSNYYNKQEVNNIVESAKTEVEAEIPTVPVSNTAFTNDAGYLTEHQSLSAYSTTNEVNELINQSVSGKQDTLSAGTGIDITNNVISCTVTGGTGGKAILAGRGINVTTGATADTVSVSLPISAGTGTNSVNENTASNTASGNYSHAEGQNTEATGSCAHSEGNATKAYGTYAHAEGRHTIASGSCAHAEGSGTTAGNRSHAEGLGSYASGVGSHAEGRNTDASNSSHAEGSYTVASGESSHAEGQYTVAGGAHSHAEGSNTITNNYSEHACGMYNMSYTGETESAQTLFSVGNGGNDNLRHNALEIRKNGDIYISSGDTDIKLQDHLGGGGGGGESCTVDEKVIVKPFQMTSYANLDAVYVCYSGQTYGQYANVAISGISSWFNGDLNFSTGDYTGRTSGWEDYYTVAWDSANARFLFVAKGNYKIRTISSYSLYYQVPLYTISGTPCDAAEELADALGDTITNVEKELDKKADYTALYSYVSKSQIWCGTQSEYDAISPKDPETLYLIHS